MDLLGLGEIGSGLLSFFGAEEANDARMQQSAQQMAFQRDMSNTSYQRSVADMQAAGLNPMLAYSKGGASTPPGAMAPVENELSGAATSAGEAMGRIAETQLKRAQAESAKAEARNRTLDADIKQPIADVAREGAKGTAQLGAGLDAARSSATDVLEKVLGEVLPNVSGAASSMRDRLVGGTVDAAEGAVGALKALPEKVRDGLKSSADSVRRALELTDYSRMGHIPPAGRGKPMGKSRGKLGSARSWDYGPDNR